MFLQHFSQHTALILPYIWVSYGYQHPTVLSEFFASINLEYMNNIHWLTFWFLFRSVHGYLSRSQKGHCVECPGIFC